jgi:hypothetical protein
MSHQPFATLDVGKISVAKPRANEHSQGKSAWVNVEDGVSKLFTVKDAVLLWPIRPGTDGDVKATDRLNIEIKVSQEEEAKARECDAKFIKALFDNKADFFGSKAKNITMVESLMPMYKPLLREGTVGKDGTPYSNSIRLKVDGCGGLVKKVNVTEIVKSDGEKIKVVRDCTWSDRIVEDDEQNAPGARDTRFFLFKGINPSTGKPMYTNKVVALDSSGNPISKGTKDGKPNYVMRYVGPQDAVPGCTLTIVWQLSKLYLTETTGPTSVAKDIYIKPKVKKTEQVERALEEVEVVDADADESLAILRSMHPEVTEETGNASTAEIAAPPPTSSASSFTEVKKRKHDSTPSERSKKSKSAVVEEDF